MAVPERFIVGVCKWLCLAAVSSFLLCTETAENCGQGRKLNAYTEFCYNGETYAKCGGNVFDPPTQFCYNGAVFPKCGGAEFNDHREFCYNGVIFAKCAGQVFSPDNEFCFHNSELYDKCDGKEFDPSKGCNNDISLPKCGGFYFNPTAEFCENGVTYHLCNGNKYDPPNNPCGMDYKLTTNIEPPGWGTVSVPPEKYHSAGTRVEVTASPLADCGCVFYGWSGALTSDAVTVTITMNRDNTLTANFKPTGVIDSRDGKAYRIVTVNYTTWMAENLNYMAASGSWCYGNSESNCAKYGRLYDWGTALSSCLSGWRLPTREEWSDLASVAGGSVKLKAKVGWSGNGTDDYGFAALPGGYRYSLGSGSFGYAGENGYWWTSATDGNDKAVNRRMDNSGVVYEESNLRSLGHSVRCVEEK